MLLSIHIIAGGFAIVTGALALIATKGSRVHRSGGLLFVYAMVVMGLSGAVLAMLRARVLPEPLLSTPARMLPIVLPFIAMFYWMWRVPAMRRKASNPGT